MNKKAEDKNQNQTNRARNLLTVSFLGSSDSEVRLIRHLKHVKRKTGVEIKPQILKAVSTLSNLYVVGEDPESTREELEDAMANFLIELTVHLSRGLSYCQNHKLKIESPPNSWKQFCLIAESIFPTESFTERKNNGGSDDLDRSSIVPIDDLSKSQGLTPDEDEEQNEDEYEQMNDEEYLAATADRVTIPIIRN